MMRQSRRRGFTLLEVVLVVALLAVVASVFVLNLRGTSEGQRKKIAGLMVGSSGDLDKALTLYQYDMGSFPEELSGLWTEPDDTELQDKWNGPYIKDPSKLKDPWGVELNYKFPGEKNEGSYDLWSNGPDKQDGTEDDIGNWKKEE